MPSKGLEEKIHTMYEALINKSGLSSKQLIYQHFDFHTECSENSTPLMDLIENHIFPLQIKNGGIFYETIRVVAETCDGIVSTRLISSIGTL
jgi:hypothetical protein